MKLDSAADELKTIVSEVSSKLNSVSDHDAKAKPAPGKWSKKEIIGHLIDSASNNHQRFVRGQFTDELTSPSYEQDNWVSIQVYNERDWPEIINLWKFYNLHLADIMKRIPAEKLNVKCRIGENKNEPVTLGFIAEDYLRHLKHHVNQLALK
jgi:hypothetical protein